MNRSSGKRSRALSWGCCLPTSTCPPRTGILWADSLDVDNWQVRIERLGNWNQRTKTTLYGLLFPLVDEADIPYVGAMSGHQSQQQPSGYIGAHKNGSFFFARRPHSNDETEVARMFQERCGGPGIHGLYELETIEALQQIRKLAHTSTRRPQYWTLYVDMLNVQGYRLVLVNEDQRSDIFSGMVYSEPQTYADLSFGPIRIRTLDAFENRGKAANQMRVFFNEVANAFGVAKEFSVRGRRSVVVSRSPSDVIDLRTNERDTREAPGRPLAGNRESAAHGPRLRAVAGTARSRSYRSYANAWPTVTIKPTPAIHHRKHGGPYSVLRRSGRET